MDIIYSKHNEINPWIRVILKKPGGTQTINFKESEVSLLRL